MLSQNFKLMADLMKTPGHADPLQGKNQEHVDFVCLFDLILYVHSTIFQLCGTVLPGLNQY